MRLTRTALLGHVRHSASARFRSMSLPVTRVYDQGVWKEQKDCVICGRPFTWRKKWERCWDEVTTCSKSCNAARRKQSRHNRGKTTVSGTETSEGGATIFASSVTQQGGTAEKEEGSAASSAAPSVVQGARRGETRKERKERKAAMKAARRALRCGDAPRSHGRKECNMCGRSVDMLVRCRVDASPQWKMVCGRCWKTPAVAGGVPDGDGSNPHYVYGGIWKNLHAPM